MNTLLKIAIRNLLRNARRSLMTLSVVAVGVGAMLCLGQFIYEALYALETGSVRTNGHLTVFEANYYEFGQANPGAYGISDPAGVISAIRRDPDLDRMIAVMTPAVTIAGVIGNPSEDLSQTFSGAGVVPKDIIAMADWDEYRLGQKASLVAARQLRDDMPSQGVLGVGVARNLGLCVALHVPHCKALPHKVEAAAPDAPNLDPALATLAQRDRPEASTAPTAQGPRVDLLTATATGAPNVVSMIAGSVLSTGNRGVDDTYILTHYDLAQSLMYGRGAHKATLLIVQLKHGADIPVAKARLQNLFKRKGLDLEIYDFRQLNPFLVQGQQFLFAIFAFIALIIGMIVLFTIANASSMTVMERTSEIGTARALGVQRKSVRLQFILEGAILGTTGAGLGAVAAELIGVGLRALNITIRLPGSSEDTRLALATTGPAIVLIAVVLVSLTVVATLASFSAANRAARMRVVDALRYI